MGNTHRAREKATRVCSRCGVGCSAGGCPWCGHRQYLHEMSRLILRSNGVVDKYIGDAIVAFWNAPNEVPDHACVACHVALMSLQRLRLLQQSMPQRACVGGPHVFCDCASVSVWRSKAVP
jgi:hypothetical protein